MIDQKYKMTSTSLYSSKIEDIDLGESGSGLTRRVLRAQVVENYKEKENSVEFAIIHQRRASREKPWEDLGGKTLANLKAGEASKMQLDTQQTKNLFDHLLNLYRIGKDGVRMGETVLVIGDEDEVIRTDKGRARIIKKLLDGNHSEEVWQALVDDYPELATKMSLAKIYNEKKKVVEEFEANISAGKDENYWQGLLEANGWVFGTNYEKRIGERRVNIGSTVDHPLVTEDGCLEIIEIKRPDTVFWKTDTAGELYKYRGKYLVPSTELSGTISQATGYILDLEKQVDVTSWAADHEGVVPLKPRCVVILGRSNNWAQEEMNQFRLLNDSLHGVTIQTFDHLLLRAKKALEMFKPQNTNE